MKREKADKAMQKKKKRYFIVVHFVIWFLIVFFAVMTLALMMCFVFETGISSSKKLFDLIDRLFNWPEMTSSLFNAYIKGYGFLTSLDIDSKLRDFNLILSMEMICSAVIVFLYSRFSEKTYGLPVEYLIRHGIGRWVLVILRLVALALPFLCLYCILKEYIFTVLFSLLDIYVIISIFVLLCMEIMQKENTIALVKDILKKEWKKLNKKREKIIPVFLHGNYLIKGFFRKMKLCTSAEVYRSLSWEAINLLLSDEDLESKIETVQEIFFLLSWFGIKYQDIDFINLFNITYGMLDTKNLKDSLKLDTLRMFVLKLDEYSKAHEEQYEEKYCAMILAVLYSQDEKALKYLWDEFFHGLNTRSKGLNLRLYMISLKFLEILIMRGMISESLLYLALSDKVYLTYLKSDYVVDKSQSCCSESFNVRLSFLLSVIGIMDQEMAMRCLAEFDRDMLRRNTVCKTGFWNLAR